MRKRLFKTSAYKKQRGRKAKLTGSGSAPGFVTTVVFFISLCTETGSSSLRRDDHRRASLAIVLRRSSKEAKHARHASQCSSGELNFLSICISPSALVEYILLSIMFGFRSKGKISLSAEEVKIQRSFHRLINHTYPRLRSSYEKLHRKFYARHGDAFVINTDLAKELYPIRVTNEAKRTKLSACLLERLASGF